jgi:hypothetical protein
MGKCATLVVGGDVVQDSTDLPAVIISCWIDVVEYAATGAVPCVATTGNVEESA